MKKRRKPAATSNPLGSSKLRIIGGRMGGRQIRYSGDLRTRPMKERVREQVFNLIGTRIIGSHALDLFAGTGALALEAISRGALAATAIERHFPTEKLIRQNARDVDVADLLQSFPSDTFIWATKELSSWFQAVGEKPATIFCCPPYALYAERNDGLLQIVESCQELSQPGSVILVESDMAFDTANLPNAENWDVRKCPPAVLSVWVK